MKIVATSASRIIAFDHYLFHQIFAMTGNTYLDRSMKLITRIGDGFMWPILTAGMLFINWNSGLYLFRAGLLAFLIELPLFRWLKKRISRSRPYITFPQIANLLRPQEPYSFPSGHTAGAFIFAYCAGDAFPILFYPLIILAWLIGLSRVYIGVHYPLDVIVGGIGGMLSAWTALKIIH
jgi:undecaprenyl-diphosphatase